MGHILKTFKIKKSSCAKACATLYQSGIYLDNYFTYTYYKRQFFMKRVKLDKIDRKILKNLQENGRITNVELAKEAGISAPPCLRRVRALEESGFITGYHAKIDSAAMGFGVTILAQVKLVSQAESDLKKFEDLVQSWDKVRECWMLAGETDFLLKIVAYDWDDYQHFLTENLTAAPNVTSVKSSLAIRASKEVPGVPIEV